MCGTNDKAKEKNKIRMERLQLANFNVSFIYMQKQGMRKFINYEYLQFTEPSLGGWPEQAYDEIKKFFVNVPKVTYLEQTHTPSCIDQKTKYDEM